MTGDDENNPPNPDFDLTIADDDQLPEMPEGVPRDFWSRLSLSLKTRHPDVLAGAAENYCGIFANTHDYICRTIAFELPPHLDWLVPLMLEQFHPNVLREAYERGKVAVWEIEVSPGVVMIFESSRIGKRAFTVPAKGEKDGRAQVFLEPRND